MTGNDAKKRQRRTQAAFVAALKNAPSSERCCQTAQSDTQTLATLHPTSSGP